MVSPLGPLKIWGGRLPAVKPITSEHLTELTKSRDTRANIDGRRLSGHVRSTRPDTSRQQPTLSVELDGWSVGASSVAEDAGEGLAQVDHRVVEFRGLAQLVGEGVHRPRW